MSGVIAHREVAVLRVTDPRVLDEIRALVPLDEFVLAVVSDVEVVVDPARVRELGARLAERGLPPLMKRARERRSERRGNDDTTQSLGTSRRRG